MADPISTELVRSREFHSRDPVRDGTASETTVEVENHSGSFSKVDDSCPDGGYGWVCVICNAFINGLYLIEPLMRLYAGESGVHIASKILWLYLSHQHAIRPSITSFRNATANHQLQHIPGASTPPTAFSSHTILITTTSRILRLWPTLSSEACLSHKRC